MARVLSLAIAALLVSTVFVQAAGIRRRGYIQRRYKDYKEIEYESKWGHEEDYEQEHDDHGQNAQDGGEDASPVIVTPSPFLEDIQQCVGSGWDDDIYNVFTGIFFGDFYTGGGTDILGSLAVKGNFHAPGYVVNANHPVDCSNLDSYNSYGLVVGGFTDTTDTDVHGSAYLSGSGTLNEVHILNNGCIVTDTQGTGHFDFDAVENDRINTNRDFANFKPTLALTPDNTLTRLRDTIENNYEIFNFNTCNDKICGIATGEESFPNSIFLAEGNWNGVTGSIAVDQSKTYVFNIPVTDGATIEIDTNNPTLGFNPCRVIYNFYPVDASGAYLASGTFTLIRRTANQFGGYTLAPRGHIVDGSVGNFSGNLVGLDYTWENLNAGVEIHDYYAAGGNCRAYEGCDGLHDGSCTTVIGTTETVTESPTATTTTTITAAEGNASATVTVTISVSESEENKHIISTVTSTATVTTTLPDVDGSITQSTTDTITVEKTATVTQLSVDYETVERTATVTQLSVDYETVNIFVPTTTTGTVTDTITDCTIVSDAQPSASDNLNFSHHHSQKHSHHHKEGERCDEEDDEDDKDERNDDKEDNDSDDKKEEDDHEESHHPKKTK